MKMQRKGFDLNYIRDLYFKYGVKNITMDDVAHKLGISKRTLYQQVKTKNDLVTMVLNDGFDKFKMEVEKMLSSTQGSILKLYKLYSLFRDNTEPVTPVFVFSLSKANPELAANIRKLYHYFIIEVVGNIMDEGQKEGDFISAFKVDFPRLVAGYIFQSGGWHLEEDSEKIELSTAFYLQIGGICTDQGKKKLDRFINNPQLKPAS
ncbi:TetR/AcrR family transcriptional regulator [Thermophagus sp. OGC60D27]|uniref:TetR/AcrR family transcriptional regulator n=1 Tax=Thermophagus sp. OGC60D27 TaxID=3458415 RepID=UPI004037BB7D